MNNADSHNHESTGCPARPPRHTPRGEEELRQLKNRLNRMVGQLNGIGRMLDENRYCGDILIQISAVERATNRMVETTTRAPVPARPAAAPGREGGGDINAYIVMDKQVVGQLVAPAVDGYIGAQMQTRR